ncbi:UDP-N-acetylglucosamine--N-acetylmuramyl-(pentapeptide) pyrophosphoryl-undecaprenol N-acetylglucosamine transferase [Rhizomicrobium palustre]|uniref:UDP-N-acetylglucosamine--N-acetylmuramyl-(pentapeptide) pyrophosphoryl-undecaprenol N-acetylglucosamine transferase n=1 Tax=Rhizomicrobium palustre TaxID=189966 RepID=A0A846MWH1_9PROT|nr:undecaprenyldiphospho-muramoylpentapeptide beta-N-acetylglucosaminyltransferase [Rhizomicrobium palustre]NIK87501.1 UDP-N-acetylglucosamine--N-acetylmuramyl-(pentapeptide) pyrophosphoryl-undecaprenol N-acetylglucosamine transferase [Rhizomicrobium palustre]
MTIVLATGGTGGHLFPAEALAKELQARGQKIVVMTDKRGKSYGDVFPGAEIAIVPSAAFSDRSTIRLISAPFEIIAGIVVSFAKLKSIRPSAVVGFGGYPSVPVMLAACFAGLPTAILSPDALLGRANRLIMNYVRIIAANLPLVRFLPKNSKKIVYTGNPLRPEVIALTAAPYESPTNEYRVLVFGGSQGARVFSERMPAAIKLLPEAFRAKLNIIQQCRPEDLESVRNEYAAMGVRAELASFFKNMPQHIAEAHLVIARSGAGTVSELACIGRPAILVPLPHALDDNQTPNAEALVKVGGGWRVPQTDFTPEKISAMLQAAFADPVALAEKAAAARSLAKPDATRALADLVETLGGKR